MLPTLGFIFSLFAVAHLLKSANLHQTADVNKSTELAHDGNVFADVVRLGAELWVPLHEVLHILDARNIRVLGGALLVIVEKLLDRLSELTKVGVAVVAEELVLQQETYGVGGGRGGEKPHLNTIIIDVSF